MIVLGYFGVCATIGLAAAALSGNLRRGWPAVLGLFVGAPAVLFGAAAVIGLGFAALEWIGGAWPS